MTRLRSNPRVEYRLATRADLVEYFGDRPQSTIKAYVFLLDGVPSGIGGYKVDRGHFVVFSEIKENVKVSKQTVWRCAKIVMDMIKSEGIPMYAVADNEEFVTKLGFRKIVDEVYQWHS